MDDISADWFEEALQVARQNAINLNIPASATTPGATSYNNGSEQNKALAQNKRTTRINASYRERAEVGVLAEYLEISGLQDLSIIDLPGLGASRVHE